MVMELKEGIVCLPIERYEMFLKYEEEAKNKLRKMEDSLREINNENSRVRKCIIKYIEENCEYDISHLEKDEKGQFKHGFFYNEIVKEFNKLGITDDCYIDWQISNFYNRRKKMEEKENA